ncbi:methyl-CpG-binding domain protein 1b isoform X2 [Thalassophryne amazonica]|uniref:methyl-CpG-binding domain protein 1b isoform X2 n=1 Tax=Thalassophryne amazonica TaxID=390379 RepID=UPI001471970C|nr:methyl-CpG-binding domain protein 1b isoform X2 [Thalassophryne amazonica]
MNEEPHKSPVFGTGPETEVEQSTEKNTTETETKVEKAKDISDAASPQQFSAPPDSLSAKDVHLSGPVEEISQEPKEGVKASDSDPPADWFEPLEDDEEEDDDAKSWDMPNSFFIGRGDPKEENQAGSDKPLKKKILVHVPRRKRTHPDEGWMDCLALGEGWKRKEVVRRSGSSIGQKDVYYMSPDGERVRSKVELASVLDGTDLSSFDYKSGKYYNGEMPIRNRTKRKIREHSSSESSWMERGEGADTPDSHHRLTPSQVPKLPQSNHTSQSTSIVKGSPNQCPQNRYPVEPKIKLPPPTSSSSKVLPAINGEIGTEESPLVCSKCGVSFIGTWYDRQRKRPCCPSCWASSKTREHPLIRFRKWIPCGQCVACRNTVNCGQCANCKHGLQSPETRKRTCRKRKCICPIRKQSHVIGNFVAQKPQNDIPDPFEDNMGFQHQSLKNNDSDNFSVNVDVDDEEELSTDDDDDRHLLPFQMEDNDHGPPEGSPQGARPRPYYTYSRKANIKKIKGSQIGLDDNDEDESNLQSRNWILQPASSSKQFYDLNLKNQSPVQVTNVDPVCWNGIPGSRAQHISNRNGSELAQQSRLGGEKSDIVGDVKKHVEEEDDEDDEDDEEEEDEEEEEDDDDFPMITQIFSLADNPGSGSGANMESQLLKLLKALRTSVMPILWYALLMEGPQVQLIQCSKQSSMVDTVVMIDPGFHYQVTVQKQPLLVTHPLYDNHPPRLTSVTEVVSLLLDLDKYVVCQGLPCQEPPNKKEPIILKRAATCDFLVKKNVNICTNCKALCG